MDANRDEGSGAGKQLASTWPQRRMPLFITLVYLLLGIAWILFSDRAVEQAFPTADQVARFQTYKGLLYVCVSAAVIYALLGAYHRRNQNNLRIVSQMAEALIASENDVRQANLELERRVEQRTRELEYANRELEAFVHAVSHDLRSPLRSMAGFSQALQEAAPRALDDRAQHYLNRIQDASRRMSELIDDLLDLSRISQSQMQPREVDFSQLIAEVAAVVGERYPGRKVAITIDKGMIAHGDVRLLRIAMDNLLDNAWKYTARNPEAAIEVGSRDQDGEQLFFVRDNGVGFDMAYADRLFGPFQRMHTETQFPGTGIGLVTVQRILARHGGRIWADAEIGKGASFTFTLPSRGQSANREERLSAMKQRA
jgi:signal transduction histidine kinase